MAERRPSILERHQVEERPLWRPEDEVANSFGVSRLQLGEDRLHQALVGVGAVGLGAVTDQSSGHGQSPC